MAQNTSKNLRNQIIYSIYVRNYSEEGTFAAVERDLERIRDLGTDIIWLMPVHPLGVKNRKGSLGSPYAIRNYREINPEFGTLQDFRSLVDRIHELGMKCMIDVVYNHTSPDSWLAENHPEYFYRKPDGRMGNRVGDWTDVVDLDYGNRELWDYQIETLKYWAEMVDGFRCDVAPLVPLEFWKKAREEVAKVRPDCIWLAESSDPPFIVGLRKEGIQVLTDSECYQAFDLCYDYDVYPAFRAYLRGELPLSAYAERLNMQEYIYPDNYVKLRFLENHDQARAKALISDERVLRNWTAFSYFQKGAALIYAGQETENTNCPSLFERDPVSWDTGYDLTGLLKRLAAVKKNPVFADSSYSLKALDEQDILVGTYEEGSGKSGGSLGEAHGNKGIRLVGIFSFRGRAAEVETELPDGTYRNSVDGTEVTVRDGRLLCQGDPIILEC
ncbi:alpha-amylase [Lachnoclostridium sp. An131]|uniref:alpha-amylase family glycosyl hydrolase n=1 Tax=Lachnoclostridium sp. An131 TaxID=1965555 RepID=UPI000B39ECB6|nr:alpha-amylase family glycosyl hydrolase [Lachnoclostridium sp. An131]OUQ28489.1 alpha-amylase [Lachnoclostridium sp. An131]